MRTSVSIMAPIALATICMEVHSVIMIVNAYQMIPARTLAVDSKISTFHLSPLRLPPRSQEVSPRRSRQQPKRGYCRDSVDLGAFASAN